MNPVLSAHCLDPAPVPDRPAAARAGGFDRIGLSLNQIRRWIGDGGALDELDRALLRHRILVGELESVELGDPRNEALATDLADRYGVRYLQAVPPAAGSVEQLADAFGELCDRFDGLTVGLEPLPWTAVPDAATAADVVAGGRGGVCLDVWHHFRHGGALGDLEPALPAVVALQLSDGVAARVEDPLADCLDARLPPGDGAFPLVALLETLGPRVHLSVEVLSAELRSRPSAEVARTLRDSVDRVLPRPDDRAAIAAALGACARLADERRPDALAERFTVDCAVSYSSRSRVSGRADLRAYFDGAFKRYEATSHLLGIPEISFDGTGSARSVVTVQAWHRAPDGSEVTLHGRYVDRWYRAATGWLIARRRLEISGAVGRDIAGFHPIGGPE